MVLLNYSIRLCSPKLIAFGELRVQQQSKLALAEKESLGMKIRYTMSSAAAAQWNSPFLKVFAPVISVFFT